MKTIKRMKRIVKMGVILSIAAIAFTAYSASASALQPAFDEDMIIDVDDVLFPEELIPLFGTDVDVEATGCLPHSEYLMSLCKSIKAILKTLVSV